MAGLRQYLDRSINKLRREATAVVRMDINPSTPPLKLYSFTSSLPPAEGPETLAKGSDLDIGGLSTANFTHVPVSSASSSVLASTSATLQTPPPAENTPSPQAFSSQTTSTGPGAESSSPSWSHVAFHGNLSLRVPSEYAGRIKSGYAGMRNRKRKTLFGEDTWDLSLYSHLRIVVAYRGWEGWRNRWYCNIQTDGPILTDLFQHRLEIPPSPASTSSPQPLDPLSGPPPSFATLHLPLSAFVLTNSGETAEHQIEMLYSKIRTVGFSLLGGGRGNEGMPATTDRPDPRVIQQMRRMASGGWGATGKDDVDPEVEALLAEDGYLDQSQSTHTPGAAAASAVSQSPPSTGGYHRVGSTLPKRPSVGLGLGLGRSEEDGGVTVTPWSEGYYELCVKTVEAVNHDPMSEDENGPETADM